MSTLTHEELQHRLAIAKDYDALTGLNSCAIGLAALIGGATGKSEALMGMTILGTWAARRYYRSRHGASFATDEDTTRGLLVAILLFITLVPLAIAVPPRIFDETALRPIAWPFIGLAAFMTLTYCFSYRHVGATRWHWATAALLVLASLLPLAGVVVTKGWVLAGFGLAMTLIGLVDHLRLERALAPLEDR